MEDLPRDVAGKIARAQALKEQGNQFFKEQKIKKAIGCYQQVGLFITGPPFSGGDAGGMGALAGGSLPQSEKLTEEQQTVVAELTTSTDLNLSACYIKEKKWEKAALRATKVDS